MDYIFIYCLVWSNGDNPLALLVASLLDEGGSASKLGEIGRQLTGKVRAFTGVPGPRGQR